MRSPPRLPWVLGLIAVIMFGLLFLLTGKRDLAAESHCAERVVVDRGIRCAGVDLPGRTSERPRHTATGTLVANMPVLLFCIAFGLSMDYEVFLVARIREYWLQLRTNGEAAPSGLLAIKAARADNDAAVALGLARTGRVNHRCRP